MVSSFRGAISVIGVRAVIQDLSKYLNGAKQIEKANEAITASSRRVKNTADQAANAAKKLSAATSAKQAGALLVTDLQKQVDLIGKGHKGIVDARAKLAVGQKDLIKLTAEETAAHAAASRAALAHAVASDRLTNAQGKLAAVDRAGTRALVAGAAIVGGFAAATAIQTTISAASSYEQALAKIDNLTNATREQTARLGDQLLELSRTIPQTPDELGATAYLVLSSGIQDVGQALEITELAAKSAVAQQIEATAVARTLTATINAYPKGAISAAQASDILIQAVREGSAEASDFATGLGRLLGIAPQLGIGFDELAAVMAVLTNSGITASQAATGLLGILNQLISPSDQAREAFEKYGTSIEEVSKSIVERGFARTMQDLFTLFGGNVDAIAAVLPEVRGLNAALIAFANNGDRTDQILEKIRNSMGVTEETFRRQSETIKFQSDILRNQLRVALIQIGSQALPQLNNALRDAIHWVQENKQGIQDFVEISLRGLLVAIEDTIRLILLLVDGFNGITSVLEGIVGQEAATTAAITAIGAAFIWAMPGGPVIKGLGLIALALGEIERKGGFGEQITGRANKLLGQETDFEKFVRGKGITIEEGLEFLPGDAGKKLREELESVKVDLNKGADELTRYRKSLEDNTKEIERGRIELPKLHTNARGVNDEAEKLREELKKLAEDFAKASEAAGQVKSLTAEFGLFGEISRQLAEKLGLSAKAAGNIQGVDAVINAQRRATNEAFNLTAALATVAQAFEQSAGVANKIVLEMARSALDASQKALGNLLGQPTREVANLNLRLAQRQLSSAQTAQRVNPQIRAAQKQLEAVNKQAAAAQRQQQALNKQLQALQKQQKEAQKQQKEALEQQKKVAQAAADAARAQLDQLKYANLLARINFERLNASLERLLDANQRQASDLQKKFLKSNEALQQQINEAIGKGQTGVALNLVDQQRQQAKAYQAQAKALTENEQALKDQQDQIGFAEDERERQARLAEAALEMQQRLNDSTAQLAETVELDNSAFESNIEAIEAHKESIDAEALKIQEHIDTLTAQNDTAKEAEQIIQEQIAVYEAQTAILKAQSEAANKTLLSQAEQAEAAAILIEQIGIESQAVKDLSALTNESLIPGFKEAVESHRLLQEAMRVTADEGFRRTLIEGGINPAAERLRILGLAEEEGAGKVNKLGNSAETSAGKIEDVTQKIIENRQAHENSIKEFFGSLKKNVSNFKSPAAKANAMGSVVSRPQLALVGEAGTEVILPITKPARARELLQSLPPNVLAQIFPRFAAGGIIGTVSSASAQNVSLVKTQPTADALSQLNNKALNTGSTFGALGVRTNSAAGAMVNFANQANQAVQLLSNVGSSNGNTSGGIGSGSSSGNIGGGSTFGAIGIWKPAAFGGIYNVPTPLIVSENRRREAVIPLERPSRAAEILSRVPPSLMASIMPKGQSQAVFAPNISISGESLETMEAMAIQAVHRAFRDARVTSTRSSGLISQGLGPSR